MVRRSVRVSSFARLVPYAAAFLAVMGSADLAQARGRHHGFHPHHFAHRFVAHTARAAFGAIGPNFAAMVVDANSGQTLYAVNEDQPRHPASITKVMTLYLLFEEIERGRMSLDSPLTVSAHAAAQKPTKLGLRPGSTITVENAIKAIVTKSANDMAVAVAENIAGDEDSFAQAMTRKAHELGMSHTFYGNASGLPDMRQLTTARDLTVLGRSIRERFPHLYHFFSTPSFTYAGSFMPNHNHLLGRVDGMDGIKTGYTVASGFNLLTSVNRDGRHLVSVVLGGRTAASRDRIMQSLIETHIEEASATPTTRVAESRQIEAPADTPDEAVAQQPNDRQPTDVSFDGEPVEAPAPVRMARVEEPIERLPPRGPSLIAPELAVPAPVFGRGVERVRLEVPKSAEHARIEAPRPTPLPVPKFAEAKPRPAFIAGAPKAIDPARLPAPLAAAERRRLASDGSTSRRTSLAQVTSPAVATATPSSLHWVTGPAPARLGPQAPDLKPVPPARPQIAAIAPTASERSGETRMAKLEGREAVAPGPTKGGWVIQIGATDNAGKANDLLSRAKTEGRSALASARPFTEKVQKGDSTLFRARFAGLDPSEAEAACRTLKRSGFACFATHN